MKKGQLVCRGDICSVSLDLFEYCGLNHPTERQKKELWMQVTEIDLWKIAAQLLSLWGKLRQRKLVNMSIRILLMHLLKSKSTQR